MMGEGGGLTDHEAVQYLIVVAEESAPMRPHDLHGVGLSLQCDARCISTAGASLHGTAHDRRGSEGGVMGKLGKPKKMSRRELVENAVDVIGAELAALPDHMCRAAALMAAASELDRTGGEGFPEAVMAMLSEGTER